MDLKDCPFCGSEARISTQGPTYVVSCSGCLVRTIPHSYQRHAIEKWNNRQGGSDE